MKSYKLNEIEYKRILGRNIISADRYETVNLYWGASCVEVCVKASEIWVNLSSDYDVFEIWACVEVNGFQTARFIVPKEKQWICIARNLNPNVENLITIIKDTQPMPDDSKHLMSVNQIGLNEGGFFVPLKERKYNIEFVGDSITSGEGLSGNSNEGDWITQWFRAGKTYAVKTAHLLNASWNVMSLCGWGICWGWDGNKEHNLPSHYENICSVLKAEESSNIYNNYNFPVQNDFVVINLGTNDNEAIKQKIYTDAAEYRPKIIESVCEFLKTIRKNNPYAKIIWCYGMLEINIVPSLIKCGIKKYKKLTDDKNVFILKLESREKLEKADYEKGARGHPGEKTHIAAAKKLAGFIKTIDNL
ncbi:MAG: hypothetical protein IKX23_05555 [Treponema sp.]|nr:hypothetical protein [Treponema sp.]